MFTKAEQAQHCRQLADLLDTDEVKGHYTHEYFTNLEGGKPNLGRMFRDCERGAFAECGTVGCAYGWGGIKQIGGTYVNADGEVLVTGMDALVPQSVQADSVYGKGAYARIFSGLTREDDPELPVGRITYSWMDPDEVLAYEDARRKVSIELLRQQADRLESQP